MGNEVIKGNKGKTGMVRCTTLKVCDIKNPCVVFLPCFMGAQFLCMCVRATFAHIRASECIGSEDKKGWRDRSVTGDARPAGLKKSPTYDPHSDADS